MKYRLLSLLLLICPLSLFAGTTLQQGKTTAAATTAPLAGSPGITWYVRPDGGTRWSAKRASSEYSPYVTAQCDGAHDAPFPAKGTMNMLGVVSNGINQPCAFNDYRFLWDDQTYGNSQWVIAGGDTVLLRGGPWRVGFDPAGANPQWCYGGGGTFGCSNPTIPAGTATQPTRIVGENYASCHTGNVADRSKMTQIFGVFGVYSPMNIGGAQYLEVDCLEITRHSQCTLGGLPASSLPPCSKNAPVDDYDSDGIEENNTTSNVVLNDLWIHGHPGRGIKGPIGGPITANRIDIAYNEAAGWDFDDGNSTPFGPGAAFYFNFSTIEWSGCYQEYPIVHANPAAACYGQSNQGYGDGIGSAPGQGLDVYIDHSSFHHNIQDGEDFGHVDVGQHVFSITNSTSFANGGQQFKWGWGFTTINFENNLILANCNRFLEPIPGTPAQFNIGMNDNCRANDALSFNFQQGTQALFANNTVVTYAPVTIDFKCVPITENIDPATGKGQTSCTNAVFTIKNNLFKAYGDPFYTNAGGYGGHGSPGLFCGAGCNETTNNIGTIIRDSNIYAGFASCPANSVSYAIHGTSTNESCSDPKFVGQPASIVNQTTLDNFNFALSSTSPGKGAGVNIAGLGADYNGFPYASPRSMGALEFGSVASTPVLPTPTPAPAPAPTPTPTPKPSPVSINFSSPSPIALLVGASVTPTCTVTYSDASTLSCASSSAAFTSDAGSFASVNSIGSVTALAPGSGHLVATFGSITAADPFIITAPPTVKTVSLSVDQPGNGFNVIPGSTRRVFAHVTNGSTNQVAWTVKSGSAKISSTAGSWIDVTAGSTGGSCQMSATAHTLSSPTQFTIQATSVDDGSQKSTLTFNVCNPTVQVSSVPAYRTLYASQTADIQSLVVGSVNDAVRWSLTTQPAGGDGKLADSTSRDTVFSANVAGRYTLTATSLADGTKSGTSILYVTGHRMPYRVTPNLTEPIDCTVDPALRGVTYEVGPSQTYHHIQDVPLAKLSPGSTIRIHNEDPSGLKPTTYNEYIQLSPQATPDQPFRLCGVPDSAGNLPILDATDAVGRTSTTAATNGNGLLTIGGSTTGAAWPAFNGAQNISVEGLHLRNAKPALSYTLPTGAKANWQTSAACIRIAEGHSVNIIGNDMDTCANGAASTWNGATWGGSSLNHLWEGNYIHGSGSAGSPDNHQMYLQAWGQVVQFNRLDKITAGAAGANLKSRGIQDIIRYNYFGDGPARDMDLVDVQGAAQFMSFGDFFQNNKTPTSSTYSMDQLAAWQEAWNSHFAYGNIYVNSTSPAPIHFAYDTSAAEPARKGNLYWYNNTFYQTPCSTCSSQLWTMFDTSAGNGSFLPQTEFQTVQVFNNQVWMDDTTKPLFQWNDFDAFIGNGAGNLLPAGWGANTMKGGNGDGWNATGNAAAYQNAMDLTLHINGFNGSNTATATSAPFNKMSWMLNAAAPATTSLPTGACSMPTRFTYLPTLGYAVPRSASSNVGSTDTPAQTAALINLVGGAKVAPQTAICH